EAGNVEENVAAAVIRAEEAEAFGLEIGHHRTALLAGRRFASIARSGGGLGRTAGLVAYALLDQGEIGFRPIGGRLSFSGNLEVRITFAGLFKQPFLACVQTVNPRYRSLDRGGGGFLAAGALLLGGRLPIALLQTAHHHAGDELL